MRLNPAYNAVKELQKNTSYKIKFSKNKEGALYCMVYLLPNHAALEMAGKIYQPEGVPHISVYQLYKPNETQGLSVFHYTWYGFIEENSKRTSVVLHTYFDRNGRSLYCQLKNRDSNEIIPNFSIVEEKNIKNHAKVSSQDVLDNITRIITTKYEAADQLVNQYLAQLDTLSQSIGTQLPKYKQTAKKCIDSMLEKNNWTFGNADPRATLLNEIVSLVENKFKEHNKNTKNHGFYFSEKTTKKTGKIQAEIIKDERIHQSKNIKIEARPSLELLQKLEKVEQEISEKMQDGNITKTAKTLDILDLLNKKFNILLQDKNSSFLENELINVLQQINCQHNTIKLLFVETAYEGDIGAVKSLRSFIPRIDLNFFAELIRKGNSAICQYMIQEFDECLFYLNNCALAYEEMGDNFIEQSYTLLQFAYYLYDDTLLLETLLKNGANPNYYGVTSQNSKGILQLAIANKREDVVRVMLENGADPNPSNGTVHNKSMEIETSRNTTPSQIRKSLRLVEKQPEKIITNDSFPLFDAITTRNKPIITLLLRYGASVTKRNAGNYDAMGYETCCKNRLPDLDIVTLLIQNGADINAVQGEEENQTTALIFACQQGDLDSVKGLIALKADPNQLVSSKAGKFEKNQMISINLNVTAFQKAFSKNHIEITKFLLLQKQQPVSFTTLAITFAAIVNLQVLKIDSVSLALDLTDKQKKIKDELLGHFDDKTFGAGINALIEQSTQFYKEKRYEDARISFYACFILAKQEKRHYALCNLASCYQNCKEPEKAIALYEICAEYAPESSIGKFATNQLEKLQVKFSSASMTM